MELWRGTAVLCKQWLRRSLGGRGGGGRGAIARTHCVPVGACMTCAPFHTLAHTHWCGMRANQVRALQRDLAECQQELFLERQTVSRVQVGRGRGTGVWGGEAAARQVQMKLTRPCLCCSFPALKTLPVSCVT